MTYFKYILTNRLWLLLTFFAIVASFVYFGGAERHEILWVSIVCGAITVAFLVGNWIKWRQL